MSQDKITEIVKQYCEAWSEPDEVERQRILEKVWSSDATYTDPTAHVKGREALVQHISGLHQQWPGLQIVPASSVDMHHNLVRFAWRAVGPGEKIILEGMDVGELDSVDRLQRIIGFFGSFSLSAQ